jgi:hypothetical protein
MLEYAEFDSKGNFESIEFPWLKSGNKKHSTWDNTVYGHISIKDQEMIVQVNSDERSKEFLALIKEIKTPKFDLVKSITDETELQKLRDNFVKELPEPSFESEYELEKIQKEICQKSWESWPHQKIPALDMKTPLEAVKNPIGREKVEALLSSFEHRNTFGKLLQYEKESLSKVRKTLGF